MIPNRLADYIPLDLFSLRGFFISFIAVYAIIVFRYFLIAGSFYLAFWGRQFSQRRLVYDELPSSTQFKIEIKYSLLTSIIFALAGVLTGMAWQSGNTKFYLEVGTYGWAYFFASILILSLIHETYFYFTHRWMHRPTIYKKIHHVHHLSRKPSPWTAFSFHPGEACVEAAILPLLVFLVPVHPMAFVLYLSLMTVSSVINHLGYEIYPRRQKWLIGAAHHSEHHRSFNCNFGLYFTFWDRLLQTQKLYFVVGSLLLSINCVASVPTEELKGDMGRVLDPLSSKKGWHEFISKHVNQFSGTNGKSPFKVSVEQIDLKRDGTSYLVGMGLRSVYIEAPPAVVVSIVNDPKYFQALYGLDKTSVVGDAAKDGSYQSRVYKLVPGVETQDFTLKHTGKWDNGVWIQRAKLVKDEKKFALRDNIKIVEPDGQGSVYREVSLFYPLRWWMRMLNGVVKNVTAKEMMKINKTVKCAAEAVAGGKAMSESLARDCHKKSDK